MGGSATGKGEAKGARRDSRSQRKEAQRRQNLIGPIEQELAAQTLEALQTGGVGARIPIAQRAVEQAHAATSAARQNTLEAMAQAGLTNTPFQQQILSMQELEGQLAARQAERGPAESLIAGAPGLALGQAPFIMGGFQGAAQGRLGVARHQLSALVEPVNATANLATAAAKFCWVAREVYGVSDSRWMLFREWLLTKAPHWFRTLYLNHGERFARFISDKPRVKRIIRSWMDTRIEEVRCLSHA